MTEEKEFFNTAVIVIGRSGGADATGFAALGEIINGTINPYGKTVDTYVKDLMETPYINNIGNNLMLGALIRWSL